MIICKTCKKPFEHDGLKPFKNCLSCREKKNKKHPCEQCGEPCLLVSKVCQKCNTIMYTGSNHPNWKGGKRIDKAGYVIVACNKHPRSSKNGYISEHTLVMEEKLGRFLFPGESVHHKNGVRSDNRIENLELWVVNQPSGQRPEDLVEWAKEILKRYG